MGVLSVVVKYLAESVWCLLVLRPPLSKKEIQKAMSLGFVRLLIGREAMLVISQPVFFSVREVLLYGVLVLGRWFAWGFLLYVASRPSPAETLLSPSPTRGARRRWQVGGVLVSCLADIPALLSGIWVGVLWL